MSTNKIKLAFAGLVVAGGSWLAGVTMTQDGTAVESELSIEDIQRIGRDHAEAQRKQYQDAGDEIKQQWWLVHRRGWEMIISQREYYKLAYPDDPIDVPPAVDPDPDPTPDPDPVDPTPDPDPTPAAEGISVPGDAAVGFVSNIEAMRVVGDQHVIYVAAKLADGWQAKIHVQDTATWSQAPAYGVIAGASIAHPPAPRPAQDTTGLAPELAELVDVQSIAPNYDPAIYSVTAADGDAPVYWVRIFVDLDAGKRYRVQAWTVAPDGSTEPANRQQLFIEASVSALGYREPYLPAGWERDGVEIIN